MPTIGPEHRVVLDVGCGAGQTLIASNLEAIAVAVGIDIDQAALVLGRQLTTKVKFVRAKGEALPFGSDTFDLVICRVAIPYMNIPLALHEMSRVLRRGGALWLVLHSSSFVLWELRRAIRLLNVKGVCFLAYVLLNGAVFHLTGRQFAFPFGPKRYESCQTSRGITIALRRTSFGDIDIDRDDIKRSLIVTARKL